MTPRRTRERCARTASSLRAGAGIGLCAGALAGALIAVELFEVNRIEPSRASLLALSLLFAAVYGTLGLAAGAPLAWLASRAIGRGGAADPLHPGDPRRSRVARRPLAVGIALALVALAAGVVAFEPTARAKRRPSLARIPPAPADLPRLLLVGIDGLDWKLTERLIAEGELPRLAAMREQGFGAPLGTAEPTRSPLIWNTIASGVGPEEHGVLGFEAHRFAGVDLSFPELVPGIGMWRLVSALRAVGLAQRVPIGGDVCRVPRFWDVAGAAGRRVAVVNWWASWPAPAVNGWLVTDRFYDFRDPGLGLAQESDGSRTVFPAEAFAELASLRTGPDSVSREEIRRYIDLTDAEIDALGQGEYRMHLIDSELRFLLSMDETYRRVALWILRDPEAPPDVAAVYLRGIDILCHAALHCSDLVGDPEPGREEEARKYGRAVRSYYRHVDAVIGELIDAAGPGATAIVLSDHGFERRPDGTWHHDHAPPGVIFGAGGLVRRGADATGATIHDVAPTLLYLSGAPVAEDLPGRILSGIIDPGHLAARPPRSVPTFGRRVQSAGAGLGQRDDAYLERLRAIGYIE